MPFVVDGDFQETMMAEELSTEKEKLEGAPGTVACDITTINVTEVISHNKRN